MHQRNTTVRCPWVSGAGRWLQEPEKRESLQWRFTRAPIRDVPNCTMAIHISAPKLAATLLCTLVGCVTVRCLRLIVLSTTEYCTFVVLPSCRNCFSCNSMICLIGDVAESLLCWVATSSDRVIALIRALRHYFALLLCKSVATNDTAL